MFRKQGYCEVKYPPLDVLLFYVSKYEFFSNTSTLIKTDGKLTNINEIIK